MAPREREVGVRISVKDAELAKRALKSFGADGDAAIKRIDAAGRQASSGGLRLLASGIQRSRQYARDFAAELTTSFLGPLAAIGTAAGAMNLLRDAIERVRNIADLGDLSDRIGLDVNKLQGLQASFKEMGNDVPGLNSALETFAVNLSKAAAQGGPLKEVFDLNGVRISGDTLTDLKTFADLVGNARSEQDRLYLTTLAFGKANKEVNDLLVDGAAGIARMADEARRLNIELSQADIDKARQLEERLAEVNLRLDAARDRFALLIAPGEIALLDSFNESLELTRDLATSIAELDLSGVFGALSELGNLMAAGPGGFMTQLQIYAAHRRAAEITVNGGSGTSWAGWSPPKLGNTPATKLPVAPDRAAEQAAKRIRDVTDALNLQIKNLTETNRQQLINNELTKAHVDAASEDGKAIALLAGQYYDQKQAIDATNDAMSFLAETGASIFEDLIDGTKSWTDVLGDAAKMIEKAVLQATLLGQGPLAGLFGTQSQMAGQPGGIFGSLLGGLFNKGPTGGTMGNGLWGSAIFGGARAGGGPVTAGMAYMVGERGPEPFIPNVSGRILPNGLGSSVEVNVSVQNNNGSDVKVSQRENANGGVDLLLMIDDAVARNIATSGSKTNKALKTAHGTRAPLAKR